MEELEAQLNEIEQALNNLESQNDNIHTKLKDLLESNREIRKEMIDLGLIVSEGGSAPATPNTNASAAAVQQRQKLNNQQMQQAHAQQQLQQLQAYDTEAQLQKIHSLSLNKAPGDDQPPKDQSSRSTNSSNANNAGGGGSPKKVPSLPKIHNNYGGEPQGYTNEPVTSYAQQHRKNK